MTTSHNNSERDNAASPDEQVIDCSATPTSSVNQNLLPAPQSIDFELLKQYPVSYAKKIRINKVDTVDLGFIVKEIQSSQTLKRIVDKIRTGESIEERQKLKNEMLPYFMFPSFREHTRLKKNFIATDFLMFDADHVKDVVGLKHLLVHDPDVFMAYISPSGDGLKIAYRMGETITTQKEYDGTYAAISAQFIEKYNIPLDKSTKDPSRATYLSYDPEIHVNLNSAPMEITEYSDVPLVIIEKDDQLQVALKPTKQIKVLQATLGNTPGNRHPDLVSIVGHFITRGVDEAIATRVMRGLNMLNEPPKEDQEIIDTVRDLYERYNKEKPEKLKGLCADFWSLASDFLEFGIIGGYFFMSKVGKEKFHEFVGARGKDEKAAAFQYLLQYKHISNIRIVKHISDVAAAETSYDVDINAGEVTVRYSPIEVRVKDNQFIDDYLLAAFGQYTTFIKEYLASYCYTNFKDLPTLVLKGARGSGKNTFAEMMYAIFPALSQTWEAKLGSFTPEAEMKLLIADETVTDSVEVYKLIKKNSGSKYLQVNKKYQIPYDVENNMNIIVLSNAAIPLYVAKEEKPTSESNNQFFVYEFKAFAGNFDTELDKKLEDRIGHYVRTELKSVFDGLDFDNNRYSIKTPITLEEKGLFESNITEEESVVEKVIDKIVDAAVLANFDPGYRQLMESGWIPKKLIEEKSYGCVLTTPEIVKQMFEQGYLVMGESEKRTNRVTKERPRCQQMTDKFRKEIKYYKAPKGVQTAQNCPDLF